MLVTLEVQGAVEALATVWADMRLAASVGALVSVEVRRAPKAFAAVPARIWPFPGMNAPMPFPMRAPGEAQPTLSTVIGFVSRDVQPSVLGQLGPSTKALPAFTAPIGLVGGAVEPTVASQLRPPSKALPTL